MPLQEYIITEPKTRLGTWHITENEGFFREILLLSEVESMEIDRAIGQKKLEKLASKLLLKQLSNGEEVIKNEFGKPLFKDSKRHLSLSHSGDYVAAIVSEQVVGIDIQYFTQKVERVSARVMNENKFKNLDPNNPLEHLHVYWGAKEALYKAYGKRSLDYRKHLIIEPFDYSNIENTSDITRVTEGSILINHQTHLFDIFYKKIKNYALVYAIEKNH